MKEAALKLQDKNIWITGSSGGIGLAMARQAVREGAAAVVLSGSNTQKLAKAAEICEAEQAKRKCQILRLCFDISNMQKVAQAAEQYFCHLENLDILVHNAGLSQRAAMLDTSMEVERKLIEVNYWGAIALTKLLLPRMLVNKRCHIGVTSSVTGLFGVPLRTTYCASKHALNGYFMALAAEYYKKGLRVTLLCPGKIDTAISQAALTGDGSPLGIIEKGHKNGISAERCAAIFWAAAKRERLLCHAVRAEGIAVFLHRLSPQLGNALIRRVLPLRENIEPCGEEVR